MTPEEQAAADQATADAVAKATAEFGWRANLPEDLRADPSLESFKDETDMISMPVNVAKSFIHTKKMVGADTFKLPKTEEEWDETYNKLGRPESKELYVLQAPEGINPALNETIGKDAEWFRETAYKMGLSDKQASELFQGYSKRVSDMYSQTASQSEEEALNVEIAMRTEFGASYEGKNVLGDRALFNLGGERLINLLRSSGMDKQADFKRFKFKLGTMMAEDLGLDKQTGQMIASKESVQEQIAQIQAHEGYLKDSHPEHKTLVANVSRLYKQLHGDAPIPLTVAGTITA